MLAQKTKIIATIGPACDSKAKLKQLIKAGANVFRLNFSHGTYEGHLKVIQSCRELNKELATPVSLLQDLQGPKIRIGRLKSPQILLHRNDKVAITTQDILGDQTCLSTSYKPLPIDVKVGQTILLNDGKIELKIRNIAGDIVHTEVVHGGIIKAYQGLNLPESTTSTEALTEKDRKDLAFGLSQEIEWIALSFVQHHRDVELLRSIIEEAKKPTKIIAKIEKPDAIKHLEDIVRVADGIMVARGDLGVEIPMEAVPTVQKRIVKLCKKWAKPVIIATHMMESMIESSRPTRAETSDVANAVVDGADAVMLSAETATGKFPVEATKMMYRIIDRVEKEEKSIYERPKIARTYPERFISDSLIHAACQLRKDVNAKAIVGMTQSGYSGFKISSNRPYAHIFIFSSSHYTVRHLNLAWGVRSFYYNKNLSTDDTITDIEAILLEKKLIKRKDTLIFITSMPIHKHAMTNALRVNVVE